MGNSLSIQAGLTWKNLVLDKGQRSERHRENLKDPETIQQRIFIDCQQKSVDLKKQQNGMSKIQKEFQRIMSISATVECYDSFSRIIEAKRPEIIVFDNINEGVKELILPFLVTTGQKTKKKLYIMPSVHIISTISFQIQNRHLLRSNSLFSQICVISSSESITFSFLPRLISSQFPYKYHNFQHRRYKSCSAASSIP